jgi:hypothetical protein
MSTMPTFADFAKEAYRNRDILSLMRQDSPKPREIRAGMSRSQIADIVSDKLMAIVLAQFDATKQLFERSQGATK